MNNKGRETIIVITIAVVIALMWFARFIPFGELSGMAGPDRELYYVTPALYFFSSIAQTMGAILGLALAAMYAIMPNIRSSKDNPAFEPARRLLQRDKVFHKSIDTGFVSILLSVLGLFTIYTFGSSQLVAIICWILFGLSSLGLAIWAIMLMLGFIRKRMKSYFSPLELIENDVIDEDGFIKKINLLDAIDFAEICIFYEAQGISNELTHKSFRIIESISNDLNRKKHYDAFILNYEKDLNRSGISNQEKKFFDKYALNLCWSTFKLKLYFDEDYSILKSIIYLMNNFILSNNEHIVEVVEKIYSDVGTTYFVEEKVLYGDEPLSTEIQYYVDWIDFISKIILRNYLLANIYKCRIHDKLSNALNQQNNIVTNELRNKLIEFILLGSLASLKTISVNKAYTNDFYDYYMNLEFLKQTIEKLNISLLDLDMIYNKKFKNKFSYDNFNILILLLKKQDEDYKYFEKMNNFQKYFWLINLDFQVAYNIYLFRYQNANAYIKTYSFQQYLNTYILEFCTRNELPFRNCYSQLKNKYSFLEIKR